MPAPRNPRRSRTLAIALLIGASFIAGRPALAVTPSLQASTQRDWVRGWGFAAGTLSLTIRSSPGGDVLFDGSIATDPYGSFHRGIELHGLDLAGGMEVTVGDGASTKVLLLKSITIDDVDYAANTVSGTAEAGSTVRVNASGFPPHEDVATDGTWSVDLSPEDIDYTSYVTAQIDDDDGDASATDQPPPTIQVSTQHDWVRGWGFAPGALALTIRSAPGGGVLFDGSFETDPTGGFHRGPDRIGLDLAGGMEATVSDGAVTKVLAVKALTIDDVDYEANTVSGTADVGSTVRVNAGPFPWREDLATDGTWSVDFTPDDVDPASYISAQIADGDGDASTADRGPPRIMGNPQRDWVNGGPWSSPIVTLTIRDEPGGDVLFSGGVPVNADGWLHVNRIGGHGVNLSRGMEITETDGEITRTLVLEDLTLDDVDYDEEIVSGTATPGAAVDVRADEAFRRTTATGGYWSVDLSPTDIDYGSWVSAEIQDADGDATQADAGEPPSVHGSVQRDWVRGSGFGAGDVTITISDTPGGAVLFSGDVPVAGDEWFHLDADGGHGVDLERGMEITATGGGITKVLMLEDLTIDEIDYDAETVSGSASASPVYVYANAERQAAVTGGAWSVDFSPGDINYGTYISAEIRDGDGDSTDTDQGIVPAVHGSVQRDWVRGEGFAPGELDLTIAEGTTVLWRGRIEYYDWFHVDRDGGHGVDLEPGMKVTVTDGEVTKSLVLENLTIDDVNYDTEIVSGTATPGALVSVDAADTWAQTIATDGTWSIDFWPGDVRPESYISADIRDDDGDSTDTEPDPFPTIHANLTWNDVGGWPFTPSSTVTVRIYGPCECDDLWAEIAVETDDGGGFYVPLDERGIDLEGGMNVSATDEATGLVKWLGLPPLSFDVLDPQLDIASGTGPPGEPFWFEIWGFDGYGEEVVAGEDGTWSIDLGARGLDVTGDMAGGAFVGDEDGDTAEASYEPPLACFGAVPTIVGTHGDDVIEGTDGPDVIAARGGNDVIDGLEGNDLICAEDGDDRVSGGAGDDLLDGGEGFDIVSFEETSGGVTVNLGAASASGAGADGVWGFEGVAGGSGPDTLTGDDGDNVFDPGGGDDVVLGGEGDDVMIGSEGNDRFEGDRGRDTLDASGAPTGVIVSLRGGIALGQGADTLSGIERVIGTPYDDVLRGGVSDDELFGEAGNDVLDGDLGEDHLDGGRGTDACLQGEHHEGCEL